MTHTTQQPALRVKVIDITNNWIGRKNRVDSEQLLTEVEWLKDGEGNYTTIVSWVPDANLKMIEG